MIASALALLRAVLFAEAVAGFFIARGDRRLKSLFALLFFLTYSTWILGTTNYGQAIRHQVLSDWLLLLTAGGFVERGLSGRPRAFSS